MAGLSNFLRLQLGELSFFRVCSFTCERGRYVFSFPLFQFNVLIYEVWWEVANTPYAVGVNSVGISFKNKALGRDKE